MLYLDASVIVPLVITEPASRSIRDWIDGQIDPLSVGRFAIGEVASAISRRRRIKQLTDEQSKTALLALDQWLASSVNILDHQDSDVAVAAQLVRRPEPKLLMPDAIHLATCRRLSHRLVTADAGLERAATAHEIDWVAPH